MQCRPFGNTGATVSLLAFGAMRLPYREADGKNRLDIDAGAALIRGAVDLGVNYVDTAPYYCDGESEIAVGRALKGIRKDVFLSTKNPIEDASGDHFRARLEQSLKKLDTDYIDFYYMWGINRALFEKSIDVADGPLEAAAKAKAEGLIRHICFSFHDQPENMVWLVDRGCFEAVLCQYNLLDRRNEQAIAHAAEKGLGVAIMGPVGGGRLGEPSPVIRSMLGGRSKSTAETALRFVFANPNVSCALSGMGSREMVEENVRTASNETPLSPEELGRIRASLEQNKKLADLYCTGCRYCMPCPSGVDIPRNFELMNYHRVYGLTDYARAEYAALGKEGGPQGKKASACVGCGACEKKCPQKLPIRGQLRETARILGGK